MNSPGIAGCSMSRESRVCGLKCVSREIQDRFPVVSFPKCACSVAAEDCFQIYLIVFRGNAEKRVQCLLVDSVNAALVVSREGLIPVRHPAFLVDYVDGEFVVRIKRCDTWWFGLFNWRNKIVDRMLTGLFTGSVMDINPGRSDQLPGGVLDLKVVAKNRREQILVFESLTVILLGAIIVSRLIVGCLAYISKGAVDGERSGERQP